MIIFNNFNEFFTFSLTYPIFILTFVKEMNLYYRIWLGPRGCRVRERTLGIRLTHFCIF